MVGTNRYSAILQFAEYLGFSRLLSIVKIWISVGLYCQNFWFDVLTQTHPSKQTMVIKWGLWGNIWHNIVNQTPQPDTSHLVVVVKKTKFGRKLPCLEYGALNVMMRQFLDSTFRFIVAGNPVRPRCLFLRRRSRSSSSSSWPETWG